MSALPAVPGNDKDTDGFEGFANKEESTGKPIFHGKHSAQAAGSPPGSIQGFSVTKRKGQNTPKSFLTKIGD